MRQLLPGVLPLAVANEQIRELWTRVQTGVINFSSGVWLCVVVCGGVWLYFVQCIMQSTVGLMVRIHPFQG